MSVQLFAMTYMMIPFLYALLQDIKWPFDAQPDHWFFMVKFIIHAIGSILLGF